MVELPSCDDPAASEPRAGSLFLVDQRSSFGVGQRIHPALSTPIAGRLRGEGAAGFSLLMLEMNRPGEGDHRAA